MWPGRCPLWCLTSSDGRGLGCERMQHTGVVLHPRVLAEPHPETAGAIDSKIDISCSSRVRPLLFARHGCDQMILFYPAGEWCV